MVIGPDDGDEEIADRVAQPGRPERHQRREVRTFGRPQFQHEHGNQDGENAIGEEDRSFGGGSAQHGLFPFCYFRCADIALPRSASFTITCSAWLVGVGTPSSAPLRTTWPLRKSISLGLPRARSCAVDDIWFGMISGMFRICARRSSDIDTPQARATAVASCTARVTTSRVPSTSSIGP